MSPTELMDPRAIARPEEVMPIELDMAIEQLEVETALQADHAAGLLGQIQTMKKAIAAKFDEPVRKAHEAHKALTAWCAECLAPFETAEATVKKKLSIYQVEAERARREEERRLQEEARRLAEAERARVEAEARAQAEELARQAREAQAAAETAETPEQADALFEQAMQLETESETLAAEAPVIAAQIVDNAPLIYIPPTKVAGVAMRENWKAECYDLKALVKAAAADERLLPYLMANDKVIGQTARALKGSMQVPGVRVWNDPTVSGTGRR